MPAISVIIPAFNREQTIGRTLGSLRAQTFGDWEAIIVDDGSTDQTAAVVASWAEQDSRFRLYRQANAGVSAARNAGLGHAQGIWAHFLDADDWIAPEALTILHAAVADEPDRTIAIGRSVLVMPTGVEVVEHPLPPVDRIFNEFARRCVHSIHASLQPVALIRAVGAFDESLVTSEDWDLWQRIARTAPTYVVLPDTIAYYRVRERSASRIPAQLMADAVTVIDRGHAVDPRLADWPGALREPPARAEASSAVIYMSAYCAGLAIGAGVDPLPLVELLPDLGQHDAEGKWIAYTLMHSVATGSFKPASAWREFPPETRDSALGFVAALATRAGDQRMLATTEQALEALIAQHLADGDQDGGASLGTTHVQQVRLGPPVRSAEISPWVERAVVVLRDDQNIANGLDRTTFADEREALGRISEVVVPAADGVFVNSVGVDAVIGDVAWDLLGSLLYETVGAGCAVSRQGTEVLVERDSVALGATAWRPELTDEQLIHEAGGWTLFLQELLGLPGLTGDGFYAPGEIETDRDAPLLKRDAEAAFYRVEIAEPLPRISDDRPSVLVEVSLAGGPLIALRIPTKDGSLSPHQLRRSILLVGKFELCRAVVRELVVNGMWRDGDPLRQRLKRIADRRAEETERLAEVDRLDQVEARRRVLLDEMIPSGHRVLAFGRRRSDRFAGSASRVVAIPFDGREAMLAQAQRDQQLVVEYGDAAHPGVGLYAPFLFDPAVIALSIDPDAAGRVAEFEQIFESEDPWDYGSPYEQRKYLETLALVPESADSALEIGCAEGFFTEMLAARAGRVLATDVSQTALDRAAVRCADQSNIEYAQFDVFDDTPSSQFDVIVCSEVLYYAPDRGTLGRALVRLADCLKPGGSLILAHANLVVDEPDRPGFNWAHPAGAAGIAEELEGRTNLSLHSERVSDYYRAQCWVKPAKRRLLSLLRGGPSSGGTAASTAELDDVPEPRAAAARTFLPNGGAVERSDLRTPRLPVLMYHRVAPNTPTAGTRWAVTPDDFEEQLSWLSDHGFESAPVSEWAHATDDDIELDGRRVVITFDDGLQDFADHALPLLVEYGYRADMHIVTGRVGGFNTWEEPGFPRYALMDWDTIRALPPTTVTLGAHTVTHTSFAQLDPVQSIDELVRSRYELEEQIGRAVNRFAYPFGVMDDAIAQLAGAAGFEYAYTTESKRAYRDRELLKIPRLEVRGGMSIDEFARMVSPRPDDD